MKTKSVLLAVLMGASVLAFANEPGNSNVAVVKQKESGIFKVIYEAGAKGNVKLNVVDNSGAVVYKEIIKNEGGFSRPLNFNGMTPGEYTIEIADAEGKKTHKVTYGSSIATAHTFRIIKTGEAGKYLFAAVNEGAEDVTVKIYDGANELVHNQTTTINGNYGVVYNLQRISGEPTFTVTDNAGIVQVIK